ECVNRMRSFVNKPVNPFIRLDERPMPTKYNTVKMRPAIVPTRWHNLISEESERPEITSPRALERIEHIKESIDSAREKSVAAAKSLRDELDDEIPFDQGGESKSGRKKPVLTSPNPKAKKRA